MGMKRFAKFAVVVAMLAALASFGARTDRADATLTCSRTGGSVTVNTNSLLGQTTVSCTGTEAYRVWMQWVATVPGTGTAFATQWSSRFGGTKFVAIVPNESCGTGTQYASGSQHLVKMNSFNGADCTGDTNNQHYEDNKPTTDINGNALGAFCSYDWQLLVTVENAAGTNSFSIGGPTAAHTC